MSFSALGPSALPAIGATAIGFHVLPLTFHELGPRIGQSSAAVLFGALSLLIATAALRQLDEAFGNDLDFVE